MSAHKKYIKNIHKQYGKNMLKFEDAVLEMNIPKEQEELFEKHGLDLANKKPVVSITSKRWGFPSRENNIINSVEDIERIATEDDNDSNN